MKTKILKNPNAVIFDNGGKTVDRYTAINKKTGDIVGFDSNPFHPMGFGQFSGNAVNRMNITFGYGWRNGHTEKGIAKILRSEIRNYINEARRDSEWLGKEIQFSELSEEAKKYLVQSFTEEEVSK